MKKNTKNIIVFIYSFLVFITQTNNPMNNQTADRIVPINYDSLQEKDCLLNMLLENNRPTPAEELLLNIIFEKKSLNDQSLQEDFTLNFFIEEKNECKNVRKRTIDQMELNKTLPLGPSKKPRLENQSPNRKIARTKTKTTEKSYICTYDKCGKSFTEQYNLTKHEKTHFDKKNYICTYNNCGKSFTEQYNLMRHQRIHTGERPYMCTYNGCGKAFIDKGALTKHERIHTGEKPYKCPYDGCYESFTQKSHLTKHKRIHTGEKPYACTYSGCSKVFRQKTHLTNHQKTHKKK